MLCSQFNQRDWFPSELSASDRVMKVSFQHLFLPCERIQVRQMNRKNTLFSLRDDTISRVVLRRVVDAIRQYWRASGFAERCTYAHLWNRCQMEKETITDLSKSIITTHDRNSTDLLSSGALFRSSPHTDASSHWESEQKTVSSIFDHALQMHDYICPKLWDRTLDQRGDALRGQADLLTFTG